MKIERTRGRKERAATPSRCADFDEWMDASQIDATQRQNPRRSAHELFPVVDDGLGDNVKVLDTLRAKSRKQMAQARDIPHLRIVARQFVVAELNEDLVICGGPQRVSDCQPTGERPKAGSIVDKQQRPACNNKRPTTVSAAQTHRPF